MTRRREFVLVRERGRTQGGRLLAVGVWGESPGRSPKAGIIVPKALGPATTRNLIKRRLREIVRASLPQIPAHHCVVTIARRGSVGADFAALAVEWNRLARRVGALARPPESPAS
jgi:ribonuclease P protein component